MASKRRGAKLNEVPKKSDEIRALYEVGQKSLASSLSISAQAEELGYTQARLALARRFANRYSEEQLEELLALVLTHKAVFGTSHVEILLAIPLPKRDKFQSKCIKRKWSRRQLIAAKTRRFPPKSQGGRYPEVTDDNAVDELQRIANYFCRLVDDLSEPWDGQSSALAGLPKRLRMWVELAHDPMKGVRKAARAELKKTQEG